MKRILKVVAVLAAILVGAWMVFAVLSLASGRASDRADRGDLRKEITSTRVDLQRQQAATQALADQVRALGQTPIVTPSTPPPVNVRYVPVPGPIGPMGRPGKTVVGPKGDTVVGPPGDSITGAKGDTGEKGDKGDTGPGPTDQQIADAVAAYCEAHNQCKGDAAPLIPTP